MSQAARPNQYQTLRQMCTKQAPVPEHNHGVQIAAAAGTVLGTLALAGAVVMLVGAAGSATGTSVFLATLVAGPCALLGIGLLASVRGLWLGNPTGAARAVAMTRVIAAFVLIGAIGTLINSGLWQGLVMAAVGGVLLVVAERFRTPQVRDFLAAAADLRGETAIARQLRGDLQAN